MSWKQVAICAGVAAAIGIIMGGLSKLFNVDFGVWLFVVPVVIFSSSASSIKVASLQAKKEKEINSEPKE